MKLKRGQVWYYEPKFERVGHVQKGPRLVVIVSEVMSDACDVVLAVPCTTQPKRNMPTHVYFTLGERINIALTEQVGPVCFDELVRYIYTLPPYIMEQMNKALKIALCLEPVELRTYSVDLPTNRYAVNNDVQSWTDELKQQFVSDYDACCSASDRLKLLKKYNIPNVEMMESYYHKIKEADYASVQC